MMCFKTACLFIPVLCCFIISASAQLPGFDQLMSMAALPSPKSDAYIFKKGFTPRERIRISDTLVLHFAINKTVSKKNKDTAAVQRDLCKTVFKEGFCIDWQTASADEYYALKAEIKQKGFYCNQEADSLAAPSLLYQSGDVTVRTYIYVKDSVSLYNFCIYKKTFPHPQDIYFADDLLTFSSHEYLVYFFGETNVKKDFYYLAGNDMVKCSVLFANTPRQVVFIWNDETNRSGIANLLFGGQQRLESSIKSSRFVGESSWRLKSGIHAGMSLYELRMLNGVDFKFYGANETNAGSIIADGSGKIDFKREDVILACINCRDGGFASSKILNADDAIADGRIVFVLSVILNPATQLPGAGIARNE